MTTRRINWTHRRRIERQSVRIQLRRSTVPSTYDAELSLADYDLPLDARVFVEAYHLTAWMRFDHGTVGLLQPPPDRRLVELDPPDAVKFRVKVLGTGPDEGRILAEADGLHPEDPDAADADREPLLPVRSEHLGEEIWRLVVEDGADGPVLELNRELGDWRGIARTPHFSSLVYPEVMRQVLRTAVEGDGGATDDPDDWRARWIRFAERLPGMTPGPTEEWEDLQRSQWIDAAVAAFCRKHRFREHYERILLEGTS